MTELCELAFKYRTDKCPQINHTYTPVYYELLKDKKESFKKVLEIGIGTVYSMRHVDKYIVGASLKMWRDFFPNAQIYGVDIEEECMFEDERIKTFQMDSTRHRQLSRLIGVIGSDIDLVVDDGPHSTRLQLRTVRNLMPLLQKSVLYIIEDCKSPELIKENLPEYDVEIIRLEKITHDNNLVIVRRK
jgi:hypothetical protein